MEDVAVAVVEINQIGAGPTMLDERQMVILHRDRPPKEVRLVAPFRSSLVDQILKPGSGVAVAVDIEVGVANHVNQQEYFYVLERAVLLPFFGQMTHAIETVGGGPLFYRFFPVGPQQPHAVAFALFSAQLVGQLQQNGSRIAAVVGTHVTGASQREVGVIVAGADDDSVPSSGKLGNQVAYRELAFDGVGGESVVFHTVALEVIEDVILQLLVIGAADRPRAEGHHFTRILHSARGIERLRVSLLDANHQAQ